MNRFERESSAHDTESSEDDGEYVQNKKKPPKRRKPASRLSQRDFELPRFSSRNGKALPNYNEAEMFSDISGSDDGFTYEVEGDEQRQSWLALLTAGPLADLHIVLTNSRGGCRRRSLRSQARGRTW